MAMNFCFAIYPPFLEISPSGVSSKSGGWSPPQPPGCPWRCLWSPLQMAVISPLRSRRRSSLPAIPCLQRLPGAFVTLSDLHPDMFHRRWIRGKHSPPIAHDACTPFIPFEGYLHPICRMRISPLCMSHIKPKCCTTK